MERSIAGRSIAAGIARNGDDIKNPPRRDALLEGRNSWVSRYHPPCTNQAAAVDTSLLLTFGWFYPTLIEVDLPACSEGDGLINAYFLQGLACEV
jgi:hypothetical protein